MSKKNKQQSQQRAAKKAQKELKRKETRKFTKVLRNATKIYNGSAIKIIGGQKILTRIPIDFYQEYKKDKARGLTEEQLNAKYGNILKQITRKGVNNMDDNQGAYKSHDLPDDANNPPVNKVRLDADVVGANPGETLGGQENRPLEKDDRPQQAPANPSVEPQGLEPEVEEQLPDAPAEGDGDMAASNDPVNGNIPELNPDGSAAKQQGTPSEVSDEPVNTQAADLAEDPSNVIGQGQVETENANAEAMQEQANAENQTTENSVPSNEGEDATTENKNPSDGEGSEDKPTA